MLHNCPIILLIPDNCWVVVSQQAQQYAIVGFREELVRFAKQEFGDCFHFLGSS
jgi:hypothetical protein